jgi:hypothetical protein
VVKFLNHGSDRVARIAQNTLTVVKFKPGKEMSEALSWNCPLRKRASTAAPFPTKPKKMPKKRLAK